MEKYKLHDAEYKFVSLVWDNEPINSTELVRLCADRLGWKKSTTYAVLKKLCKRGILQNKEAVVTAQIPYRLPGRLQTFGPGSRGTKADYRGGGKMNLLQQLFSAILNMSITASYVALGVILLRLLLGKAPKVFSYVLWAAVFFRLICPFSFTSDFSLLALINAPASGGKMEYVPDNIGFMRLPAIQSGIGSIDGAVNSSLPQAVPAASVNPLQIWLAVLSLVWIAGVIILSIHSTVSYVKIKRKLQMATLLEGNVYESDAIDTAFVCGIIRPKIYVPVGIRSADLAYILEHERTHLNRRDYLIKPLAFLALILHWFNPMMWLSFALMSRDMEMSCDESVLGRLGDSAKGGYSGLLLSLAVKRTGLLAANPLAFGESHVKARIKNILSYKKPAFWVMVMAVVAVCAAVVAFVANPADKGVNPEPNGHRDVYKNSAALPGGEEVTLPDFAYDGDDPIAKLVYATETEKNSNPKQGFTVVAPKIFGCYKENGLLKVFVTTYSATYRLYGNVLEMVGGSVVPSAITYKEDGNGNYMLEEYQQARDGTYFAPSIREFCTMPVSGWKIPGLAEKILSHYGNYEDLRNLHRENLLKHLRANGIKEAKLYNAYGEIEFFMASPSYRP